MMQQKTAGALMVLVLAGCGSSSSGGGGSTPSDVARFVGTWTISTATLMATCPPPIPAINTPITGEQTIQQGTDSD